MFNWRVLESIICNWIKRGNERLREGSKCPRDFVPFLCALFSGTGSEEYSSYWSLLSDPLAGSKLGRENNTFGRSGARLCL